MGWWWDATNKFQEHLLAFKKNRRLVVRRICESFAPGVWDYTGWSLLNTHLTFEERCRFSRLINVGHEVQCWTSRWQIPRWNSCFYMFLVMMISPVRSHPKLVLSVKVRRCGWEEVVVPIGWWIAFTAPWQSPFLKVLVEEGIPLMQPRTRTVGLRFDWGVACATEKQKRQFQEACLDLKIFSRWRCIRNSFSLNNHRTPTDDMKEIEKGCSPTEPGATNLFAVLWGDVRC